MKISAEIAALDKRKRRRLKMDRQALEWHTSANVREKKQFKPFDLKLAKRAEKEKLIKLRKVDVVVMLVMVALGISVFFVVSFVPIINSDLSTAVKLSE